NSLKEVVFNDRLRKINKGAFVACAIQKLVLPESLDSITNQAFLDNIYLEEITIGPKVKFIGYLTFYVQEETIKQFNWKSPLKKITCLATVPPELQINVDKFGVEYNLAWNEEVYENVPLYVPKGCGEAYRTAPEWKQFKNIVELENSGVSDVTYYSITASNGCINIVGEDNPYVEVYDIIGSKVYGGNTNVVTPSNRGVYVVRSMGKTVKVIL
ncbi:MAG: leucine-rich repeat domain-containing protein, partial [Muribaculaceae bacterium]|nr:leucine-rich repeat domain-containing protein [Muribaculaceae bacterium]